jgi:hypothetical protein
MDEKRLNQPKYSVVGGCPFRNHTHYVTYTGITVVGVAETAEEAAAIRDSKYSECNGLLVVIDLATGLVADV